MQVVVQVAQNQTQDFPAQPDQYLPVERETEIAVTDLNY